MERNILIQEAYNYVHETARTTKEHRELETWAKDMQEAFALVRSGKLTIQPFVPTSVRTFVERGTRDHYNAYMMLNNPRAEALFNVLINS